MFVCISNIATWQSAIMTFIEKRKNHENQRRLYKNSWQTNNTEYFICISYFLKKSLDYYFLTHFQFRNVKLHNKNMIYFTVCKRLMKICSICHNLLHIALTACAYNIYKIWYTRISYVLILWIRLNVMTISSTWQCLFCTIDILIHDLIVIGVCN